VNRFVERIGPSLVEIAVLAFWLGAAVLFSAVVAPSLFAALPTRTLAGVVVGRVLPSIFYSGIVVGALVILLQMRLGDGWSWRGAETAGGVMVLACAIAQFVIAPRIERIRAAINGPVDTLPLGDPQRMAFGRLHGFSVGWLGLAMLAAAAAIVLASRWVMSKR
jgi:hypothetical protein